jgi:hypothetical protein
MLALFFYLNNNQAQQQPALRGEQHQQHPMEAHHPQPSSNGKPAFSEAEEEATSMLATLERLSGMF